MQRDSWMVRLFSAGIFIVVLAGGGGLLRHTGAQDAGGPTAPRLDPRSTNRLLVQLHDHQPEAIRVSLAHLSKVAGVTLTIVRPMLRGTYVLGLPRPMNTAELADIVKQLRADPAVQYAEPDYRTQAD